MAWHGTDFARCKCGLYLSGDEIYRSPPPPPGQPNYVGGAVTNPPISMFEVDGKKAKVGGYVLPTINALHLGDASNGHLGDV
jgi:hypothetical protein